MICCRLVCGCTTPRITTDYYIVSPILMLYTVYAVSPEPSQQKKTTIKPPWFHVGNVFNSTVRRPGAAMLGTCTYTVRCAARSMQQRRQSTRCHACHPWVNLRTPTRRARSRDGRAQSGACRLQKQLQQHQLQIDQSPHRMHALLLS